MDQLKNKRSELMTQLEDDHRNESIELESFDELNGLEKEIKSLEF